MWLNQPGDKEIALVRMVYGNQAELDWVYSHAAILVTVPTRERRDNDGKKASDSPVKQNLIDVATF